MDRVCPMLALAGDRRATVDGVDSAHRCHAEEPPAPLDRATQAQLCLTAGHDRCDRYLAFVARTGAATPGRLAVAGGLVSTRFVLAPQPAWRGIAGRARGTRPLPVIAAGAGVVALGLGTVAVTNGVLGPSAFDAATPSARPSATPARTSEPTEPATPSPTPTPTASPSPSPSPTPTTVPTPSPTPAPPPATPVPTAPPPPPQQTYTVQQGDTLAEIAQLFGTTTQALQQANGIEDPNEIFVGQVLVIP